MQCLLQLAANFMGGCAPSRPDTAALGGSHLQTPCCKTLPFVCAAGGCHLKGW